MKDDFNIVDGTLISYTGCDTDIVIPDGVKTIGYNAFTGCYNITSIEIPDSIMKVGELTSAYMDITELYPIKYNEYDNGLYLGNGTNPYLVLIKAKNTCVRTCIVHINTKIIASYAFEGCSSLESIIMADNIVSIEDGAFDGCSSLTKIKIPKSIINIGERAFIGCESLLDIQVAVGNSIYDSRNNCNAIIETKTKSLILGCGSTIIPDNIESIGEVAFYKCNTLENITIPSGVKFIGREAFSSCNSLRKVIIPNGVESIELGTFSGCISLSNVTIPDSVTSIEWYAFSGCISLTKVYYEGNSSNWNNIDLESFNTNLTDATIYYYSETQPTDTGNYWHYVDGVVTEW